MVHLKGLLRSWVQFCLRRAGKTEKKIASVFGVSAAASHEAVLHLRLGAPDIPIWLFTTVTPLPETEALCERVYRNSSGLALALGAQTELWRCWVAISVGTWTGSGAWAVKLAPFLIPPFRVLILNRAGGFFSGTPANIFIHVWRAAREALHNGGVQAEEALDTARSRVKWAIHPARVRARNRLHGISKLSTATGLRIAATLLGWMFNPHVRLFERLRRDQPLMLDEGSPAGEGFLHFRQQGAQWDGARLEEAARASDARWLLWQSGEEADMALPEDGMNFFQDSRTFAMSRQVHLRGWKKGIAATAPFRTLRAGEATRVLAPLAGSILVDRKKLLALGIPRGGMAGTAWLILFWKAAAAGWRSYSIGQPTPPLGSLPEQPESPIQDTAFVLQALFDPVLRRLCPRQEDLSRGNISFQTSRFAPTRNWDAERLKVLIVSPFLPYPLSHGGAVRIYNLCRELADRVDFTLVAMRESNDVVDYEKLHQVFREVYVVDKDEGITGDPRLPAQVSASESSSLRALIAQLSQKLLPDLIQIEYTHFAAFRDCAPGVPAILVEHDLTFSLYRQLAEANSSPESWLEYRRWMAFERHWLHAYEGVWTVSEQDRLRAIKEGHRDSERTFPIANGVDLDRFHACESAIGTPEILYVGSFRHLPNIIGFERLCAQIMPRVWENSPDTVLQVVAGPEHERYWRQFGRKANLGKLDPRIIVHGFVADLQPLYDRAWVVAVPLEVSAGTNIKVLEAMACGKPIVSTPVGCAGLDLRDGYDIAIRKDWGEFSDTICKLLASDALRSSLSVRARWTAESSFSWKEIANRAFESYLAVAGKSSRSGSTAKGRATVA